MKITAASEEDVLTVASNLRDEDAREIDLSAPPPPLEACVLDAKLAGSDSWIFGIDGQPIACLCLVPHGASRRGVGFFATPAFPAIARAVTTYLRNVFIPWIARDRPDIDSCHAVSVADRPAAHRWMLHLGATRGPFLPGYGRDGSDFIQFSWNFARSE